MSLREPNFKRPNNHAKLVLERLHGAAAAGLAGGTAFATLCERASIPRDLRLALLREMVTLGYVTEVSPGQIKITKKGTQLAVAPSASGGPTA